MSDGTRPGRRGLRTAGPQHEPHDAVALAERTNRIRAAVLGANDGIVSTAGLVLGVAGATTSTPAILTAGLAGLVAGALSMAAGEYVSVSSQRDTEAAAVDREKVELATDPDGELAELADLYQQRGLSPELAHEVAEELTRRDALAAHSEVELGIDPGEYVNPWNAAVSSLLSFTAGALLPLLAMAFVPQPLRVLVTFVAVLAALTLTGYVSARLGGARPWRAVARNVGGGAFAMIVTFAVGRLIGNWV
ncbi:MAG: VIT family protein [Candidatus Nanopelagicales bacterium]